MNDDDVNPSNLEVPKIPDIPEELLLPVQALVRFAHIFRGAFMQSAEGQPLSEIYEEIGEYLLLGDKVITAWMEHLDIEVDE